MLDISAALFIQRTSKLYEIGKYHQVTILQVLKSDLEIVTQQLPTLLSELLQLSKLKAWFES